jgi:hypothetical protein
MKDIVKCIFGLVGSRQVLMFLIMTSVLYLVIETAGLFRAEPASTREILHSTPARVISILFAVNSVIASVFVIFSKAVKRKAAVLLFLLSIPVMVAGLWTSMYTRFEGKAIRSQGQVFNAFRSDYVPRSLYRMRYSLLPSVGMHFGEPEITHSADMKEIEKIEAVISYAGRTTGGKILGGRLSSRWPMISDWTLIQITDFGYEIKYTLMSPGEDVLEKRYFDMKLFPIGSEGSIEPAFLGYVFYVRCYPDYVEKDEHADTLSLYVKNPACNLRIVRNKDIVFNGILKPEKKLRFDNYVISLTELRPWIEVTLTRDLGLPVTAGGMLIMIIGAPLMVRRKRDDE